MKTINSFKHLRKLTTHQVTAQELLNGQTYLNDKGWTKIRLKEEFREEILQILSEIFGGQAKTQSQIYFNLRHENRQHWGLDRAIVYQRGKRLGFTYCTGQDQTYEHREIRKALSS